MKTLHWKNSPVESLDFHNSTTWSGGGMKLILRSLRSASWESLLQLVTIATTSQGAGCNVLTHVSASMCLCRPRVAHGNGEQNKVICIHLQPPNSCIQQKKTLAYLQFIAILGWQTPFWNDPGLIRLFSFEPIAVPGCGEPKPDNQKQSPPMERTMTIVQIELQAWVARTILKHWNIDSHRRSCHLVFHRLDKQHTGRSQNLGNRECLESYAACLSF